MTTPEGARAEARRILEPWRNVLGRGDQSLGRRLEEEFTEALSRATQGAQPTDDVLAEVARQAYQFPSAEHDPWLAVVKAILRAQGAQPDDHRETVHAIAAARLTPPEGAQPVGAREEMIAFVQAKASDARKYQASRTALAIEYRDGTDAEWEAGRSLAERQTGRSMPPTSAPERARESATQDRIASKYGAEAVMFDAIAAALATPTGQAAMIERIAVLFSEYGYLFRGHGDAVDAFKAAIVAVVAAATPEPQARPLDAPSGVDLGYEVDCAMLEHSGQIDAGLSRTIARRLAAALPSAARPTEPQGRFALCPCHTEDCGPSAVTCHACCMAARQPEGENP